LKTIHDYVISKKYVAEEPVVIIGGIKAVTVKANDITVIGRIQVSGTLSADKIMLIGHGLASRVEAREAYLIANGPLFIDVIKADKAYLFGRSGSVIADFIKSRELFMERSYASRISAEKIRLSWGTGIRVLEEASEIVFLDPHVWFEEIRPVNPRITYKYSIHKPSS